MLLLHYAFKKNNMRFIDNDLQEYTGTNFSIYKTNLGTSEMSFTNGFAIPNSTNYANIMLGQCVDCSNSYYGWFNGFTYDKVLVAGLGFGLIPQTLSEVNGCSLVDVVEIDQEIIDYNISSGHLNADINITQSDIFNYTTVERYDLIIIDTIFHEGEMSEEQYQSLVSRFYNTNLNSGGVLYVPIIDKWLVK